MATPAAAERGGGEQNSSPVCGQQQSPTLPDADSAPLQPPSTPLESREEGGEEVDFIDPNRDLYRHLDVQRRYMARPQGGFYPGRGVTSIKDGGYRTITGHTGSMQGVVAMPVGVSELSPLLTTPVQCLDAYSDDGDDELYAAGSEDVPCSCVGARWVFTLIGFFVFLALYMLRFNVSVAVVAMTTNSSLEEHRNGSNPGPEFEWTPDQLGYVNSAFFYGYMGLSLPAGWLAGRFGAHPTLGAGMLVNSVLCLLTPLVAKFNFATLLVLRVMQGLAQALVFPSFQTLLGKWGPRKNVGSMASLAYAGCYSGIIVSFLVGGTLGEHGFGRSSGFDYDGDNWPSIFYVFGCLSLITTFVWIFFTYESPAVHPRISRAERREIEKDLIGPENKNLKEFTLLDVFPVIAFFPARIRKKATVPWRSILLSRPVWAMAMAQTAGDFGGYTLMTCVPKYYKDVLKVDIQDVRIP